MNSRTVSTLCAGIAVFSGIVAANLWRDLRNERAQTTVLRTQLEESAGRVHATLASVRRDGDAPATPVVAVPAVETAAAPGAGAPAAPVRPVAAPVINQQQLLDDPEYREARLAMSRATLPRSYPDVVEELGLNPDEADRLFDLLAEHQVAMASQAQVMTEAQQADPAQMTELARNRQAAQRQQATAIRELLGDSRYAQWEGYQQTRGARQQAGTWASLLAEAGAPLDNGQRKSLVTAAIAEQRSMQQDMSALSRSADPANPQSRAEVQQAMQKRQAETQQRILQTASSHLSAQQISALRSQFEQQAAINSAMLRAQERVNAASAAPAAGLLQ